MGVGGSCWHGWAPRCSSHRTGRAHTTRPVPEQQAPISDTGRKSAYWLDDGRFSLLTFLAPRSSNLGGENAGERTEWDREEKHWAQHSKGAGHLPQPRRAVTESESGQDHAGVREHA